MIHLSYTGRGGRGYFLVGQASKEEWRLAIHVTTPSRQLLVLSVPDNDTMQTISELIKYILTFGQFK
jgi:hypothetical protein